MSCITIVTKTFHRNFLSHNMELKGSKISHKISSVYLNGPYPFCWPVGIEIMYDVGKCSRKLFKQIFNFLLWFDVLSKMKSQINYLII